ncbi:MAG TPA: choice-of-anchor D domain-containing protein [Terriglobales bacterium]|nr:choice-of-anchor D domain-containing protein [Terriglobales bacterium]
MRMRSITNAQRARAAKNARARYAAAIIAQRAATPKMAQAVSRAAITSGFPFAMNPADLYFGVNPNYAFSPLPIGSVGAITVTDVGSGYVDPVVTITDAYVMPAIPASATATVTGGAVTSINILNLGSGYIAPVVTITDNLGAGATATASLDPQTVSGGIRKFVDSMPGICGVAGGTNALGQCLPLAVPDTATYPGSDFYQIGLSDYTQKMHSDLPATHLRGYYDLNAASPVHQYLGPVIIAERNRPVRVLFKNLLPTSGTLDSNGTDLSKLLIPMDSTYMGAGKGPDGTFYTQNRAVIHLHGGNTPWISDGTPHQWITPAGETATLLKGVSFLNVPDMIGTNPGQVPDDDNDGQGTQYWPNQQSGRMLWFHDHAYGITRLNVYSGEAGAYLLFDPQQESALRAATVPGTILAGADGRLDMSTADLTHLVPLVIQDKTFVDANTLAVQDPTWRWGSQSGSAVTGDLWFPHVYMPNQWPDNPDLSGTNPMGRWDYGPWFWPPQDPSTFLPEGRPFVCQSATVPATNCPGTPNPAGVPEGFMDTPIVNGTAYPVLHVAPEAYRMFILNAANDRALNLQLYLAYDPQTNSVGRGTEVRMVPAIPGRWPVGWPTPDARDGGWPDPATVGPQFIEIGTEGGLLPSPAVIQNRPIGFDYARRSITVLNILEKALLLGPAERAEAVVDFTAFAGKTLILYNDAPAPVPAFDNRLDPHTGARDQTASGGPPETLPGYGPNIRTIMQIVVDVPASGAARFNLATLSAAMLGIFRATQDPVLVPEKAYGFSANTYSSIQANSLTFVNPGATVATVHPLLPKTIQELFTLDYGRMNSTLGVEVPFTNFNTQTTIPYGYIDPPTEVMKDGAPQIWKITHNGVDTHFVHFHLFSVQVLNRVGWDGAIKPPDPNELSWKDTVRMNPLEDIVVAAKGVRQQLPWPIPDSIRPLDVTAPVGTSGQFTNIDPNNQPIRVFNDLTNFGWEYVWHCHLLGHEENDMMRPIVFQVPPEAPSSLSATASLTPAPNTQLSWTDNSVSASSFNLQRAADSAFTQSVVLINAGAGTRSGTAVSFADTSIGSSPEYYYRVQAVSGNGASSWSNTAHAAFQPAAALSAASISFGDQAVGTSAPSQTVTLSNTGGGPLTIAAISLTGTNATDFTQVNACGAVPGGSRCFITVAFQPSAVGASAATLTITSNDPANPTLSVALNGNGIPVGPPPVAPSNLTATLGGVNTIALRWSDRSNNEAGFYVERSNNNVTWLRMAKLPANTTAYTNTGLARRTTYWYRVQAFNSSGVSTYSNTATRRTR